jgi:hypothetical protein
MALVTTAEIAATRLVSVRTVNRMVTNGELVPEQKLPGKTGAHLFDPDAVERAFAARSHRPAAVSA